MFNPSQYEPIDLSIGIEPDVPSEPWPPTVESFNHEQGAALLAERLQENGFEVKASDFPEGIGLAWEEITAITHTGTHMDAPWHYGPTVNGESARTIDEVPLEWTMGQAVVLDLTWKEAGSEITPLDLEDQFAEVGHEVAEGDIVLIETGADDLWGTPEYLTEFPGMSAEATKLLIDQGVRVIGTDAYGFDKPFAEMARRFVESDDERELWPAHFAGREVEYCQIEKMANLDRLPRRTDIPLVTVPIKIEGASAGWVRPVAFVEEGTV
jgi:kynurenine formamidase